MGMPSRAMHHTARSTTRAADFQCRSPNSAPLSPQGANITRAKGYTGPLGHSMKLRFGSVHPYARATSVQCAPAGALKGGRVVQSTAMRRTKVQPENQKMSLAASMEACPVSWRSM